MLSQCRQVRGAREARGPTSPSFRPRSLRVNPRMQRISSRPAAWLSRPWAKMFQHASKQHAEQVYGLHKLKGDINVRLCRRRGYYVRGTTNAQRATHIKQTAHKGKIAANNKLTHKGTPLPRQTRYSSSSITPPPISMFSAQSRILRRPTVRQPASQQPTRTPDLD